MTSSFSKARRVLLLGAAGGAALIAARRLVSVDDGPVVSLRGATMGTEYTVKVADQLDAGEVTKLQRAVDDAFDRVDRRMSIFRPDSEVSRLNRSGRQAQPLSSELLPVLAAAQRVSRWSGGAFDITVGPLVERWGFGTAKRSNVPPTVELSALRPAVNWRGLRIDPAAMRVAKADPRLQIDLGGIAKGYGVDLAAAALDRLGIRNYMIELGGEVRTAGLNAQQGAWRIGVEQPDARAPRARLVVGLSGRAMATSGDYRIFFEQHGRRYSHEIDPSTAAPIAHGLASATVVADDCMQADALATALIVLGPDLGFALAQRSGVAAHFVLRTAAGELSDKMTTAFSDLQPQMA